MSEYDYDRWDNFTEEDLICQHTGKENPNVEDFIALMDAVQVLRTWIGIPFYVSSAYRSPEHPIEARKVKPGQHSEAAIDFRVDTWACHMIVKKAFEMGFTGIGINLTGSAGQRFIHLDKRTSVPRIWSY
jgi:hypothetical protein